MKARLAVLAAGTALAAHGHCLAADAYPFSIETERTGEGFRLVARNLGPVPVSARITLTGAAQLDTDRPFPLHVVVPPGSGTLPLARIRPAGRGVRQTLRTEYAWIPGDFNAVHAPGARYRLPFRHGLSFRIGQAPGGPITTHHGADSRHAVDIPMPEGTTIVAARSGIVIHTEAGHFTGGQRADMLDKANAVRILHDDATIATYAHLAPGGVLVSPGQRVAEGQPIGLSGSTGYSSGPHLHLVVQAVRRTAAGFEMVSLPFRFYTGNPPVVFEPEFGKIVKADYGTATAPAAPLAGQGLPVSVPPALPPAAPAPLATPIPRDVPLFPQSPGGWTWLAGAAAAVLPLLLFALSRRPRRRR